MRTYTDPVANGYIMEAKACEKIEKDLRRLVDKYAKAVKREEDARKQQFQQEAAWCVGWSVQRGAGERTGRAGNRWSLPLPVLPPLSRHWCRAPWPPRLPDGHILPPLPHGSCVLGTCGPSAAGCVWFG